MSVSPSPQSPGNTLRPLGVSADPVTRAPATRQAIVIGAGFGGLLASRILSEIYDHVLILERDTLPAIGTHRKGVPQGRHVHALMARGRVIIEELFPGISDQLIALGAIPARVGHDVRWHQNGGYHCNPVSPAGTLLIGRATLEGQVRTRLLERGNVSILEQCSVQDLALADAQPVVTGVLADTGDGELTMLADLVVDASGRGSQLPVWLGKAGFAQPQEVRVGAGVRYATRLFERSPDHLAGKYGSVIVANPATKCGAVALAQEGNVWIVTLVGRGGIQPPVDLAGFIEYARSLAVPDVYQLIAAATPIDDGTAYGFPQSLRRFYERIDPFPDGLLAIGDAICTFNPVYAQGMTVATLEALTLRQCLTAGPANLGMRFFQAATPTVNAAWNMTAGGDARFAPSEVKPPRKVRAINWYLDRLHIAARIDPEVAGAFAEVVNFNQPPTTLMTPALASRVLRGNLRENWRTHSPWESPIRQ